MELKLHPRLEAAIKGFTILAIGAGLIVFAGLYMTGMELGAKQKVADQGLTVTSLQIEMFGCMGKGRTAYRFTTVENRNGKICYGGGFPAKITFDDE